MPAVAPQRLSPREEQVVVLVLYGKTNAEIAQGLHLAEGTVHVYMSRLFKKLGLPNRTALAVWAYKRDR